ncbi:MAG: hypothetical protein HKN50_05670 [Gammaproteobacteria bacterium]|nr:hypothetical protein [Gammaproteobacteria bacterium]
MSITLRSLALLCLLYAVCPAHALTSVSADGEPLLRNLERDKDGFLANVGSDGYLVLTELNKSRDQACGLLLDLEFKAPMARPGIFDIFWRSAGQGFSESRKAFVIINQTLSTERTRFFIPLCKLYQFSGNLNRPSEQGNLDALRIDFPGNKDVAIKFHAIELLDGSAMLQRLETMPVDERLLEPYERVSAGAFTSLDVAVPKLYFAFKEGLHRLTLDRIFLVVWLLIILLLFGLLLRSFRRPANR